MTGVLGGLVRERIGRWSTVEELDAERCRVRMTADSLDWPTMALGVLGAEFRVLDPPELARRVHDWAPGSAAGGRTRRRKQPAGREPARPVPAQADLVPAEAGGVDMDREWATRRDRAVAARGAELARREAAEAARAAELLREFVAAARERGLPPVPLTARSYGGARYRTRLRGWYLNPGETAAVAEDGNFYLLTVPGSLTARFAGVDVAPATPRLVLGEGGRDGERIPLRTVLGRILDR